MGVQHGHVVSTDDPSGYCRCYCGVSLGGEKTSLTDRGPG